MRINGDTPISELYHSEDELAHHGVKGMKWGVRRYQNKDGSLTNAGKKRYVNAIKKATKGNTKDQRIQVTISVREDLEKNYGPRLRAYAKKLRAKRDALELAELDELDYYDSPACRKDSETAYKNTVNWFKKNDPEYLDRIVNDNGGKTTNLDVYHDFRKVYDGNQDEAWSAGLDRWNKQHGNDMTALRKDYEDIRKKAVDEVIGHYGYQKIDKVNGWDTHNVRTIVENAIVTMNYNDEV